MQPDDLLRTKWYHGQLMAFSALDGPTDYADGLVARTVVEPDGIEIRDPGVLRIRFTHPPESGIRFGGDFFSFDTAHGVTRGCLVDAHHLLIEGACIFDDPGPELTVRTRSGRLLAGATVRFDESHLGSDLDDLMARRSQWLLARDIPGDVSARTRRTLARVFAQMKHQVYSPEGNFSRRWTTPDRWPHKDMWLWDTAFHAVGWRHLDPELAAEMIDTLFELQRDDGFLTYRGTPRGPYFHLGDNVTQPPVLAHAADLVHRISQDDRWIESLYPKIAACVEWDFANRDSDGGGLMEWYIEDDPHCRSGESGMDNSPRFDRACTLDAVDFNAYLARECEILAVWAARFGQEAEALRWKERHATLCRLLNERCWCEKSGFYFDYDPATGRRSDVWACVGFLPLYCGAAGPEQARQLAEKLRDPGFFGTALPIPSIAACDTAHYSKDLCRGPVWIQINWLIASGFERYGLHTEADFIRSATQSAIEDGCETYGVPFEYYDDRGEVAPPDLDRKGRNAPEVSPYHQVIHDFGWTATLYLDMVLREPIW
ncbi:MAG: trehalase family glycosidase [Kiritimatiellia bacterium]